MRRLLGAAPIPVVARRGPKLGSMIVIPVILLVVALVVAVVAGLAWSAKLPGNGFVGIRAPEARKSKENWDITHRVAGPPWAVAALGFAGAAALSFVAIQPEASGWMWLWVVVAVLLGLAMIGVGGAIGSHTIALYDAKKSAEADAEGGCCSAGGSDSLDDAPGATCGSGCDCGSAGAGTTAGAAGAASTADAGATANAAADPAADCGVPGGCGSCGLNGMCEGGTSTFGADGSGAASSGTAGSGTAGSATRVDRDAMRRAARAPRATDAE